MEQLLNKFSFESLMTSPTRFKSVTPTCIDLILTNHKQYFMKSQTHVTAKSHFYTLTLNIMRNTFYKGNPKTKFYRDYTNFDCEIFQRELSYFLQLFQSLDYTRFHNVFLLLLNKYAPVTKKNYGQNIVYL